MAEQRESYTDFTDLNNELVNLQRQLAQRNAELEDIRESLEIQVDAGASSLSSAVDDLVRAMRAKDAFFARMSHDLRTPLNSIIGFSGLLLGGYAGDLSDEQRAQVEMISQSGSQLLSLVSDILELADADAERANPEIALLDPRDVIATVLGEVRPLAESSGLEIVASVDPGIRSIRTDGVFLRRILASLLSNGIKYTDAGRVSLDVSPAGDRVEFRVADTGIGIRQSDREVIFEAFVRGDIDDPIARPGSGLGLAIARQLAESLGGSLDLERTGPTGSTFLLSIPEDLDASGL